MHMWSGQCSNYDAQDMECDENRVRGRTCEKRLARTCENVREDVVAVDHGRCENDWSSYLCGAVYGVECLISSNKDQQTWWRCRG